MLLALFLVAQTKIATIEGITEWQLPNGLRVLTLPDASKPTITVNVTYLVGSRNEDYGETGMAHLLEHLMFKGTPSNPNVPKLLSEKGARANGTTSYDRTNYYETFAANDDNLQWALKFEADRMINSNIAKKDLDSEMTVVRNEYEAGENSPNGVLLKRVMSTMYLWHNYGNSVIGARSDIERVPIDRLQGFYRKYYQPDNAVLIIAGRIDEAKTLKWVMSSFGQIAKPARPLPKTYTVEPVQDGERVALLRRTGDVQVLMLAYHVPAGSHADFAAVDVVATILGTSPTGRLYKALVDTKKAARVSGSDMQLHDPGILMLTVDLRKEQSIDEARDIAIRTVEAMPAVTADEVEKARAELMKQIEALSTASDRLAIELSDWVGMDDWRMFFVHRDRIAKVTVADVQRVAQTYLKPSNRTLGVFYPTEKPDRAEIPEVTGLPALLAAYKGQAATAQGEAFDATPANIEARTKRSVKGPLKTALLEKKTRNEVLSLTLNLHLGNEAALTNRDAAGSLVAPMLLRGTKKHTREQIKDTLDQLKARVSMNGGPVSFSLGLEVERKNLAATLALLLEVLREPAFDSKELEQLRQEQLAGIESQRTQPQTLGSIAFQRTLKPWPKGHPLYPMTLDESHAAIAALKVGEVKAFYDEFYGATGELAVVGDFDAAAVQKFIDGLSGWTAKQPYKRIAEPYRKIAAKDITTETPDKANAFMLAGTTLELKDTDADYPAMLLANYMLGGGFLNSRLATRIRQKEGISYGVGSVLQASAWERSGGFFLYAIFAPENLARLEAAYKEEITKATREGFTKDEIESARTGLLQSREVQRSQDNALAGMLASSLFLDRTLMFDADMDKKLVAVDGPALLGAMKRIDAGAFVVSKAGDFAAKKK